MNKISKNTGIVRRIPRIWLNVKKIGCTFSLKSFFLDFVRHFGVSTLS